MKILVLNCGSSSLKYKLFDMGAHAVLASGQADRIGLPNARFRHEAAGQPVWDGALELPDHRRAVDLFLGFLTDDKRGVLSDIREIAGVGHRVVHGGERFRTSVVVDANVRDVLESTKKLAPLHNPPNLAGIDIFTRLMPEVPQVAVFDTAFHATLPPYAYTYAIPYRYYLEDHVRRYGFHGISHRWVAARTVERLKGMIESPRIITCHLGAGSSLCAVSGGKSRETSMGFTPLSGLVMATRSGDIDPAVVSFIMEKEHCSIEKAIDILNRQSGVWGISGLSPDFRDLTEAARQGNERAKLALEVYAYSVARGVGSLLPAIGGLDALVFTAGIGENSPAVRRTVCGFLSWLGVLLDEEKNTAPDKEKIISARESRVCVFVTPTDEERLIARETQAVLERK
jgi:acetate kinase